MDRRSQIKHLLLTTSIFALGAAAAAPEAYAACATPPVNNVGTISCVALSSGLVLGNIVNTNTGTIDATVANTAVSISGTGSLIGFIQNNGLIEATAPGAADFGIRISGAGFLNGPITGGEGGVIEAFGSHVAVGIGVESSTPNIGGINNAGLILAAGTQAYGIRVQNETVFTGGITNTGAIGVEDPGGNAFGMFVGGSAVVNASSAVSVFTGGITASGIISVSSTSGNARGIFVGGQNASATIAAANAFSGVTVFTGGITNSATVIATVSAGTGDASGIHVGGLKASASGNSATAFSGVTVFAGGITNGGPISASTTHGNSYGVIVGGTSAFAAGAFLATAHAFSGLSVFTGGITNSSTILASTAQGNAYGILVGGGAAASSGNGSASAGLDFFVSGDLSNGGAITVNAANSKQAAGILFGGIAATASHAGANAFSGVSVGVANINNTGSISVSATTTGAGQDVFGILVGGKIATALSGNGTSNANAVAGVGLFVGNISNSTGASISATTAKGNAYGALVGGVSANAHSGYANATAGVSDFIGNITNSGGIRATASNGDAIGVLVGGRNAAASGGTFDSAFVGVGTFVGGITNTVLGGINASVAAGTGNAYAILVGGLQAAATGFSQTAFSGVRTFTGGISNLGSLGATVSAGTGDAHGIYVGGRSATNNGFSGISTFAGGITNGGLITSSSFSGNAGGIFAGGHKAVSDSTLSAATAGIDLFSGSITNGGVINVTVNAGTGAGHGINVGGGTATGNAFAGIRTFAGGITNTNEITVSTHSGNATGIFAGGGKAQGNGSGSATAGINTFTSGVTNSGSIVVTVNAGTGVGRGIAVGGGLAAATSGHSAFAGIKTFSGGVSNSAGLIMVSTHSGNAQGIGVGGDRAVGVSGAFADAGINTFNGNVVNTGGISLSVSSGTGKAVGVFVGGGTASGNAFSGISTFSGGVSNTFGVIQVSTHSGNATGIFVGGDKASGSSSGAATAGIGTFTSGVANTGLIGATVHFGTGNATGIFVGGKQASAGSSHGAFSGISTFSGGIANNGGAISVSSSSGNAVGIFAGGDKASGSSGAFARAGINLFNGNITNAEGGTIRVTTAEGSGSGTGIFVGGRNATGDAFAGISTFAGGVSNAGGLILVSTHSGAANGIFVGGGTAAGNSGGAATAGILTFTSGITNSGVISVTVNAGTAPAHGIFVGGLKATGSSGGGAFSGVSTFSGGIVNAGSGIAVSAHSGNAAGIFVGGVKATGVSGASGTAGVGIFNGGVTNSAPIFATAVAGLGNADGIFLGGRTASGHAFAGIGTFNGGVTNSSEIFASSHSGNARGIFVGGVRATGSAATAGIGTFNGGITNTANGFIEAVAHAGSGSATGIFVGGVTATSGGHVGVSAFNGGISNAGEIFGFADGAGAANGIFIGRPDAAPTTVGVQTFNGGINNSGTVLAHAFGINAGIGINISNVPTFNNGITNSSLIEGIGHTGVGLRIAASTFNGGITNTVSGQIIGVDVNFAHASGIHLLGSTFNGGITNAGFIGASGTHAIGINIGVSTFNGNITNSGTIIAGLSILDPATGILSTVAAVGTIQNSGLIQGSTWGINLSTAAGPNTINNTTGTIVGGIDLSDTVADTVNISGGRVEASILGGMATVNQTGGELDILLHKSVGTGVTPIADYSATGGTIKYTLNATPSPALTTTNNGFINAVTTHVTNGVTVAVQFLPDLYALNTTYHQVLGGTASFTGPTVPEVLTSNSFILQPTLACDTGVGCLASGGADQIDLHRGSFAAPGFGLTPNEIQTGLGLNGLANSGNPAALTILGPLETTTNKKFFTTALDQLGGYQYADNFNLSMGVPIFTRDQIQTLLAMGPNRGGNWLESAQMSNSGIQIASAGGVLSDAGSGQQVAQGPRGPSAEHWTIWSRGYGVFGNAKDQTSPNHDVGYDETRGGGLLGADYTFSDHFILGGVANYSHNDVNFNQNLGKTGLDNLLLGVYGQYRMGPWYVNGTFQGGWDWYSTDRNIFVPVVATAHSSYDGQTYGAYAETGYDFRMADWKLTPLVGIGWLHGHLDNFTETGAGAADLAVHASDADSIQSSLGARVSTRVALWGATLVPEVRAVWQHEFGDQSNTVNNSFALSPSSVFTQQGTKFGRESGIIGAGLTYVWSPQTKLFLDYDYKTNDAYTAHAVMAGFRWSFGAPSAPPPAPVAAPPPPQPAPPPPAQAQVFVVYFDFDKSTLTPEAVSIIQQATDAFKRTGAVTIKIDGYTDLAGTQRYNIGLSKRRADAVRAELVKDGVPTGSVAEAWHGKSDPAVPTPDGVREPRNRRVTLALP